MRRAYEEAIREGYRFYSYGDCMFVSGRGRDLSG
jgi:S-adenosylmethionine:tRNA-ribosyltransferase-isomerase (queuine synthetase)